MVAGILILTAVVVLTAVIALLRRWYDGRFRSPRPTERLDGADLDDAALGERATLVQFSSAFCAPCRATRQVLDDVTGMVDGVAHVEIDAESHLDLVRRLDIRRTPTVVVLDKKGRITSRASGRPRKADVIAALGDLVT
ncbi:MAG: thioredoxin [Propionibacteriales bacterium]|nr:thioredoxin [Propionibacteriales bacterium]